MSSKNNQNFKKSINMRLVGAINEIENPKNTLENPFHKSKYVPLSDIIAISKPVLKKHGLAVIQQPETIYHDEHGNQINGVGIKITNIIVSEEGEEKHFPPILFVSNDTRPQAIGSTITYAKRYSLASILGVAGKEEDDDGNQASHNHQEPTQTQQTVQYITEEQVEELKSIAEETAKVGGVETKQVLKVIGKPLTKVSASQYGQAKETFEKLLKRAKAKKSKSQEQESSEDEEISSSIEIKSIEKGESPNGVTFLKVITQDGEALMARGDKIIKEIKKYANKEKTLNVIVEEKNGFNFITEVKSIEEAS